jgi:hypothetical protein
MVMSFAEYNRPWIEEMRAQKELILRTEALGELREFLAAQQAHKTPLLPIPLSFDREEFDGLARAGLHVMSAQTKILQHLQQRHSRDELLKMFDIPEMMAPFVDWDELIAGEHVVSRFDIVPSNDGYYFCEVNRDSSVGGIEVADCLEVLCTALHWPLTQAMESPQRALARLLRRVIERDDLRRIVICDWSSNRGNGYFGFELLRQHLARAMPELEIHLTYETGYPEPWLTPDEGRHTLVYRGFMYQDMTDRGAFFRRLWDSGATIINTFETELRMNKGWFARFCDPRYHPLLTPEEREAIERHVPHTVAVDRDNLEELLRSKADRVFKLGLSSGGEGVLMGADHSAAELRALIEAKGVERWSAQRVISFDGVELPYTEAFEFTPHNVVLGLYVIDGRPSGLTVAASSCTKIVNIHTGVAGYTWAVPMTTAEQAGHLAAMRDQRPAREPV